MILSMPASSRGLFWLLIASFLTFLLTLIPFARVISYPFQIFSTFIHETCHALSAVLTFGQVESLTVSWNGSGVTYTRGGIRPIIYSAGYLGTAFFGGWLLLLSRNEKWVRPGLATCAILVALATLFFAGHSNNLLVLSALLLISVFTVVSARAGRSRTIPLLGALVVALLLVAYLSWMKSLFSWGVGLAAFVALMSVLRFASVQAAHFFLSFLGIQCSLNALEGLRTLYFISSGSGCKATDAAQMASLTGIPAVLWAILWAVLALGFLLFSLWRVWGIGTAK